MKSTLDPNLLAKESNERSSNFNCFLTFFSLSWHSSVKTYFYSSFMFPTFLSCPNSSHLFSHLFILLKISSKEGDLNHRCHQYRHHQKEKKQYLLLVCALCEWWGKRGKFIIVSFLCNRNAIKFSISSLFPTANNIPSLFCGDNMHAFYVTVLNFL